jgi:putative nucleotidyltransferase with HDIG domain
MRKRTILVIAFTILLAIFVAGCSTSHSFGSWQLFLCYLLLCLISACFKVALPGGQTSLSFNVPYIMLALVWLPLPAALIVAAASALVICTFRVSPPNTPLQILFNLANAVNSTALAWYLYQAAFKFSGQTLPSLVLAATVYFVVNSISVAAVLATLEEKSLFVVWRHFFWPWPYYPVGALLASLTNYVEIHAGRFTAQMVLPLAYLIYCICRSYAGRLAERAKHASDMAELHLRTIETLALAIEAKDQNTHDHLCRVRVYASGIASRLKLSENETEALMAAALLHDIGKLAVPEYIINKPGKLTPDEFERMKIHPVVGAQILERVAFPYPVVPIVRSHHEQWNGGGYPDGLKGEEIPIGARILSAVDCFDALASDRPYRRGMPLSEAAAYVQKSAGVQFDPEVVRILSEDYEKLEKQARAESGKLQPLNTDIIVRRGEAPKAGLERSETPARGGQGVLSDSYARRKMEMEITRLIADSLHTPYMDYTLPTVVATLGTIIPFDMVVIYRRDGEVLRPYYVSGAEDVSRASTELPIGSGLCGWVAHTRQTILNGNPAVEPQLADPRMQGMQSSVAVPLVGEEDSVLGVLALYHCQPDAFSSADLALLLTLQPSFTSFLVAKQQAAVTGNQGCPEAWVVREAEDKGNAPLSLERGIALATSG